MLTGQTLPKRVTLMEMDYLKWPVYSSKDNGLLEIRADSSAAGEPDPKKARLDVIEKAVTSGNLH